MSKLNLSNKEKKSVQSFTEELQQVKKNELQTFITNNSKGNKSVWHRFIKGAYSHPLTWWMGIFQLQMQTGVWGHNHQAAARIRANKVWLASKPIRNEALGLLEGKDIPMIKAIVKYNWNNRKSDILGRFIGGQFTNYASLGGRFGNKKSSNKIKGPIKVSNFIISSYGAAIKAVGEGSDSIEEIIQSILTGDAKHLPDNYDKLDDDSFSEDEKELYKKLDTALTGVLSLSQIEAKPVSIKEFCSRPENINLKDLCK